jgi:hypothetical protein
MNPITSIYIPHVDKLFDAEFISNIFDKNGIAKISKIVLEPYSSTKEKTLKYNRAYIGIKFWHDTEAAFNFIDRLRNPLREARIVYKDDYWWSVEINKFPEKLKIINNKIPVVTIFSDPYMSFYEDDDNYSTIAVSGYEPLDIDYEKTRQLKAIIYGYKNADEMEEAEYFDGYLHEFKNQFDNLIY